MPESSEFLTVREVMALLRLGRTTVYAQARLYEATGGEEGIPCRRFGRSLRFPAVEVRRHGGLPPEAPTPAARPATRRSSSTTADRRPPTPRPVTHARPAKTPRSQSRRTASARADDTVVQPVLPFTD